MKKKALPIIIAIVLILVIVAVAFGKQILDKYAYSDEVYDMTTYFENSSDSDIAIILQDDFMSERAYLLDGTYYVDIDFVRTYLNDRFYVDENENLLIYTLPLDMITTEIGSGEITDSNGTSSLGYTATRMENGKLLVALDYVRKWSNFSYEPFSNPGRIQMYTQWNEIKAATVKKDTQVRHKGGIKSPILKEVPAGEKLTIIEEMEEWSKVKTNDGIIGFIENKRLNPSIAELPIPVTDYVEPEYTNLCRDYKINMAWQIIAGVAGNDTLDSALSGTSGINVLSPTWFTLLDSEGNYDSYASTSYISKAHDKGIEVWPTFNNIDHSADVDLDELFSYTSKRQSVISRLIAEAVELGIDGINVDIEMLPVAAGKDFSEFIRELSIECRKNNLVLSVDNYVPIGNTDYYDRKTQGEVADYVVIMGYDEHYAGSQESGSVASIGYVETGIVNTLKEVPASKIINGIPFFTRVWELDGPEVTSRAMSMPDAKEWMSNHNVELTWDEQTCQYYGEVKYDGKDHQIWVEDADSISAKLSVMNAYEIAGVAEWCLTQETSDIWDVIAEYLAK